VKRLQVIERQGPVVETTWWPSKLLEQLDQVKLYLLARLDGLSPHRFLQELSKELR